MLSEDLMKDARLRFEDAMCTFQRRKVAEKAFHIFGISVSVTVVALHLSIFDQLARLASQPAKRERRLAFCLLSWQADTGPI